MDPDLILAVAGAPSWSPGAIPCPGPSSLPPSSHRQPRSRPGPGAARQVRRRQGPRARGPHRPPSPPVASSEQHQHAKPTFLRVLARECRHLEPPLLCASPSGRGSSPSSTSPLLRPPRPSRRASSFLLVRELHRAEPPRRPALDLDLVELPRLHFVVAQPCLLSAAAGAAMDSHRLPPPRL